jgi:hypothetical protein
MTDTRSESRLRTKDDLRFALWVTLVPHSIWAAVAAMLAVQPLAFVFTLLYPLCKGAVIIGYCAFARPQPLFLTGLASGLTLTYFGYLAWDRLGGAHGFMVWAYPLSLPGAICGAFVGMALAPGDKQGAAGRAFCVGLFSIVFGMGLNLALSCHRALHCG